MLLHFHDLQHFFLSHKADFSNIIYLYILFVKIDLKYFCIFSEHLINLNFRFLNATDLQICAIKQFQTNQVLIYLKKAIQLKNV